MIAGRMTERVVLMEPTATTDGFGSEVVTYSDFRTVHAEVQWKTGGIFLQASELFPDGHIEVIIRDAHPVEAKWRIRYNGEQYQVGAVAPNRVKGLKRLICDKVND